MSEDVALQIPITAAIDGFKAQMEQVKGHVSSAMSGVRDAMGAVGLVAAGYLKGAIENAVKAQTSTERLKIMLENQGQSWNTAKGSVDNFVSGIKNMSVHTGGEAKDALQTLLSKHVSLNEAMKMQIPITELAAAKHISLSEAANVLADAENGRTRGLVSMGILTKDELKTNMSMDEILGRIQQRYKGLSEAEMNTLPGQIALIKRNFTELSTSIGTVLLPYITKLAEYMKGLSDNIKKLSPDTISLIAHILAATAAVGTLVGGMSVIQKVGGILTPVLSGLGINIGAIGTAIKGALGPISLIIGAITLFTVAYKNNWGGLKTTTDNFIKTTLKALQKSFADIQIWFKAHWPEIKAVFDSVMDGIKLAFEKVLKPVLMFMAKEFGVVVDWVKQNWPLIKETILTVMNFINDNIIKPILGKIVAFWQNHGETIIAVVRRVWDIIKTVVDTVIHVVLDIIKIVMSLITGHWDKAWNALVDAISRILGGVGRIIGNILGGIGDIFSDMAKNAVKWGEGLINGFIDGINNMAHKVKDAAHDVVKAVKDFLGFKSPSKEGEGRHIVEWGANMIGGFMDGVRSQLPNLKTLMNNAIQAPMLNANVNMGLAGGMGGNKNVTINVDKFYSQSMGDNNRTLQQLRFMSAI